MSDNTTYRECHFTGDLYIKYPKNQRIIVTFWKIVNSPFKYIDTGIIVCPFSLFFFRGGGVKGKTFTPPLDVLVYVRYKIEYYLRGTGARFHLNFLFLYLIRRQGRS